jgi:acetaldehyde dehydrogenase (acetylating)
MSIHSRNEPVILEFGLKKPAFRIVVNTPTTHGSIGLSTGLDPAMTLGCGGYGGNITSDNISPKHLLNIKRLAYELRPATASTSPAPRADAPAERVTAAATTPSAPALPKAPVPPPLDPIDASLVGRQVDAVVGGRGRPTAGAAATSDSSDPSMTVADFVCEEDVRQAIRLNRKILIGERTIVTPSARDLAESHRIFAQSTWPRG